MKSKNKQAEYLLRLPVDLKKKLHYRAIEEQRNMRDLILKAIEQNLDE